MSLMQEPSHSAEETLNRGVAIDGGKMPEDSTLEEASQEREKTVVRMNERVKKLPWSSLKQEEHEKDREKVISLDGFIRARQQTLLQNMTLDEKAERFSQTAKATSGLKIQPDDYKSKVEAWRQLFQKGFKNLGIEERQHILGAGALRRC